MGVSTGVKPISKGNGKWLIRICCGYDGRGRKRMTSRQIQLDPAMSPARQLAEAIKERDRMRLKYEDGLLSGEKDVTLKAYAAEWMDSYCRRKGLAESTIAGYQNLLDTRILPSLGKTKLRDCKPAILNHFFVRLGMEGLGGTYQRKYYNLLHLIFSTAVREQRLAVNPMDGVEPPRKDTAEHRCYSAQECGQLVSALEGAPLKWQALVLLMLGSGIRRGEALGLNWEDVDFARQSICIRRALGYAKGKGQYLKDPKTASGWRTIRIDRRAMQALRAWKQAQAEERLKLASIWNVNDEGAVFTQDDGKRMCIHSPTQWFTKFLAQNGLPPMNLHGLRHTSASLLLANGAAMTDVSKRLGHSRVSTTMDIYAHAYEEGSAHLAQQMESLIYGTKG